MENRAPNPSVRDSRAVLVVLDVLARGGNTLEGNNQERRPEANGPTLRNNARTSRDATTQE